MNGRSPREGAPESTAKSTTSIVRRTADSRRRAMMAGLELSYVLHQLAAPAEWPADLCANRCGALLTEDRDAYARRRTCPCRDAS